MALHTDVIPEHVSPEHIRDLCVTLHGVQDAVTKAQVSVQLLSSGRAPAHTLVACRQAGLEHARQAVSEDAETRRILEALEFEVLAGMTYSQWANVKLQVHPTMAAMLRVRKLMFRLGPAGCCAAVHSTCEREHARGIDPRGVLGVHSAAVASHVFVHRAGRHAAAEGRR